ncbi:MAG: glutaredoxin 2 [Bdellovibrionales bacterium]|jgi:glutaredoxin 2|nr:glutaredoxin 2 [Bdellovibrionales bacterium]
MVTLFHYIHCPFCIRIRLALGILNISYKSVVLDYDDEETPIQMTGNKMLPIVKLDDQYLNESLDIIKTLDKNDILQNELTESKENKVEITSLLEKLGKSIHNLCMPYWVWTPEFTSLSRKYFREKKEIKRGHFADLMSKKSTFLCELNESLSKLEDHLMPFYNSKEITIMDIMIASHLWGMFVFPEFRFPDKVYNYLTEIKKQTNFNYHEDYYQHQYWDSGK